MIENSEGVQGRSSFLSSVDSGLVTVREVKDFKSYGEQLAILEGRGMAIENREEAIESLAKVNYYRLLADIGMPYARLSVMPLERLPRLTSLEKGYVLTTL